MILYTHFVSCLFIFFFFKQKTAYEMRISDWSSDVCSSDLHAPLAAPRPALGRRAQPESRRGEHPPVRDRPPLSRRRRASDAGAVDGGRQARAQLASGQSRTVRRVRREGGGARADRKSTRLNSSH